jgi:hypothetical protein
VTADYQPPPCGGFNGNDEEGEHAMKRREFLAASSLAAVVPLGGMASAAEKPAGPRQYLELRHYELASADKQKAFDAFLADAAIPALNRLDIGPVGVFKMAEDEDRNLWVLLPHKSLESVAAANTKMLADARYQQSGSAVLNCPKDDPAYQRLTSRLLLGFDYCPNVEVPSKAATRVFQLRIYESHNTIKAKRKIEMCNEGGEIALFRETGLDPVFFGESLIGDRMTNLTYMVGFDDAEAQKKAWDAFRNHPGWTELRSKPYYADTVSHITNLVLRPTAASQI